MTSIVIENTRGRLPSPEPKSEPINNMANNSKS